MTNTFALTDGGRESVAERDCERNRHADDEAIVEIRVAYRTGEPYRAYSVEKRRSDRFRVPVERETGDGEETEDRGDPEADDSSEREEPPGYVRFRPKSNGFAGTVIIDTSISDEIGFVSADFSRREPNPINDDSCAVTVPRRQKLTASGFPLDGLLQRAGVGREPR